MPLSRLYKSADDASAAVGELHAAGFNESLIKVIAQGSAYISGDSLVRQGVLKKNADGYANAVRGGAVLLIVEAPMGSGQTATEILETPRSADTGAMKAAYEGGTWDEAAPLSSAFNLPVLAGGAAPLSNGLGLNPLSKDQAGKSTSFGFSTLMNNPAPLSSMLGLKTVTKGGFLSSLLGLPMLSGR